MPTIHYKHLHQHQQSFVTLNSPSPFDVMRPLKPDVSRRLLFIRNWKQRTTSFPQTATTCENPHLFIYFPFRHHAKSNIHFMFPFACFHLVLCASSVHLRIFSTLHAPLFPPSVAYPMPSLLSFASNLSTSPSPQLV